MHWFVETNSWLRWNIKSKNLTEFRWPPLGDIKLNSEFCLSITKFNGWSRMWTLLSFFRFGMYRSIAGAGVGFEWWGGLSCMSWTYHKFWNWQSCTPFISLKVQRLPCLLASFLSLQPSDQCLMQILNALMTLLILNSSISKPNANLVLHFVHFLSWLLHFLQNSRSLVRRKIIIFLKLLRQHCLRTNCKNSLLRDASK